MFLLQAFAALFSFIILPAISGVMYLAVGLFDLSIQYSLNVGNAAFYSMAGIEQIWGVARDLANIIFIFILFFIATYTVLQLGEGASLRKNLVKILIVAILVNFSLTITRLVVDASNVMALTFYDAAINIRGVKPQGTMDRASAISTAVVNSIRLQTIYKQPGVSRLTNTLNTAKETFMNPGKVIMFGVIATFIMVMVTITFLQLTYAFLVRMIIFVFLMMLSPLAFVVHALPKDFGGSYSSYYSLWWKKLTANAIYAPVQMFFIYAILLLISCVPSGLQGGGAASLKLTQEARQGNSATAAVASSALAQDASSDPLEKVSTTTSEYGDLSAFMPDPEKGTVSKEGFATALWLFFVLGFIIASKKISKMTAEGSSSAASGMGNRLMSVGKAAVAGAIKGGGWAGAAKGAATAAFVGDRTGSTASYALNAKMNARPTERPEKPREPAGMRDVGTATRATKAWSLALKSMPKGDVKTQRPLTAGSSGYLATLRASSTERPKPEQNAEAKAKADALGQKAAMESNTSAQNFYGKRFDTPNPLRPASRPVNANDPQEATSSPGAKLGLLEGGNQQSEAPKTTNLRAVSGGQNQPGAAPATSADPYREKVA